MANSYFAPAQPDLLGPVELVTPSTALAVSLDKAKEHLRLEADFTADDTYIEDLIHEAKEYCEREIPGGRTILHTTYDVRVPGFWDGPLKLPRPPLSSVTSVKYYDTAGTDTTLAASYYVVRTPWRQPGTIERAPDQTWPSVQSDRREPLAIRFVAGYGSAASSVPRVIRRAILLLVAEWYVHRGDNDVPDTIRQRVEWLLLKESWGSYA